MMALAEIDLTDARIGDDLSRCPLNQDATLHQHRDAAGEAEYQLHIMLDDQHSDFARKLLEHVKDDGALGGRYPSRWLIQQQNPWLQAKGYGNLDQALLAVRQFPHRHQRIIGNAQSL